MQSVLLLLASLIMFVLPCTSTLGVEEIDVVHSKARRALIYLQIHYKDKDNPFGSFKYGTAFFITADGYALTSAHLFYENNDLTQKRLEPLQNSDFLTGGIGTSGSTNWRFDDLMIEDKDLDLAIIQLRDPPAPTTHLKLCGSEPQNSKAEILACGFAGNNPLACQSGKIIGNNVGKLLQTNASLNPGMSGGPIFSSRGYVIGVITSGLREPGFERLNYALPIQYTLRFVSNARINSWDCNPGVFSVQKPPLVIGSRTVLSDGWRHYDASSFSFHLQSVGSWVSASGDIAASNIRSTPPLNPEISLFLPYDAPPFPTSQAKSGIAEASLENLSSTDDCEKIGTYRHHWFQPEKNKFYCVRTRDGKSYAKIWVADMNDEQIFFDWIYQPNAKE